MTFPHVPAAFINAIAEEGTKAEAVEYLQKQWNENCALRVDAVRIAEAAAKRIAQLEADLNECREYLESQMDVVDGSYGKPAPNRAMRLVNMIDETLHGPGGV